MTTPSVLQSARSAAAGAPATAVLSQPTSGNFLVAFLYAFSQITTGVSDSAGNTWTAQAQAQDASGNWVNLFTAPVTLTGSGNNTLTSTNGRTIDFIEVTGNKSSTPINGSPTSGTFSGSAGGTVTAAAISTSDANCLLLSAAIDQNSATLTVNTGNLIQNGVQSDYNISQYHQVTATGNYSEAFNVPVSASETAVILSFAIGGAPNAPTINTQPQNQTVLQGNAATFSVAATTSGGALSYQWQVNTGSGFNNVILGTGGTSASFTTAATNNSEAQNGYTYLCKVTDSNGTTNTVTVGLTVITTAQLAWIT